MFFFGSKTLKAFMQRATAADDDKDEKSKPRKARGGGTGSAGAFFFAPASLRSFILTAQFGTEGAREKGGARARRTPSPGPRPLRSRPLTSLALLMNDPLRPGLALVSPDDMPVLAFQHDQLLLELEQRGNVIAQNIQEDIDRELTLARQAEAKPGARFDVQEAAQRVLDENKPDIDRLMLRAGEIEQKTRTITPASAVAEPPGPPMPWYKQQMLRQKNIAAKGAIVRDEPKAADLRPGRTHKALAQHTGKLVLGPRAKHAEQALKLVTGPHAPKNERGTTSPRLKPSQNWSQMRGRLGSLQGKVEQVKLEMHETDRLLWQDGGSRKTKKRLKGVEAGGPAAPSPFKDPAKSGT